MSEKQTLSALLRSKEVYRDVAADETESINKTWRNNLLSEFDTDTASSPLKHSQEVDSSTPLEVSHLLSMMPVGLALFGLGWAFGSQTLSLEQIARVSPWVWVGGSVVGSLVFLMWRGQSFGWRR